MNTAVTRFATGAAILAGLQCVHWFVDNRADLKDNFTAWYNAPSIEEKQLSATEEVLEKLDQMEIASRPIFTLPASKRLSVGEIRERDRIELITQSAERPRFASQYDRPIEPDIRIAIVDE